jgi:O-antigen ligase
LGLTILAGPILAPYADYGRLAAMLLLAACFLYIAWHVDPAWLLTGAILASSFNGNWGAFGLPSGFAPDRALLLAGVVGLLIQSSPAALERPRLQLRPVHALLALTVAWAVGSAIAAQTLGNSDVYWSILDRMAVPFAVFALAPLAFRTSHHRRIFLATSVAFGAYLGVTAWLEVVGPNALVVPQFINDSSLGYHPDRAEGPFLEAAVNGVGLYVSVVACAVAIATWKEIWARRAAAAVMLLCTVGLLMTLTRSVWVAAIAATVVAVLASRDLRRLAFPMAVGVLALVLVSLAVIPGFSEKVQDRTEANRPVWERRNVDAAALEMVSERPLLGFGPGKFNANFPEHAPVLDDVPQVAPPELAIHNVPLLFATELGLVGLTLFLCSFVLAIGGTIVRRGPPELRPWRVGLLAIAIFFLVIVNFAPMGYVFPNMIAWLWAGIVLGGSASGS